MRDSDPIATFTQASQALNQFNLAYLHILEALPGHMLAAEGERVGPHMHKAFGCDSFSETFENAGIKAKIDAGQEIQLLIIPHIFSLKSSNRIISFTTIVS